MTMTTSERPTRSVALVERLAGLLERRTSRRGFLSRTAVVGSALAVAPTTYVLRPGTAYANVCGTDSSCSSGYTVFCATINNGVNRCPPNALVGGWWKSDNSGFCCGSARYYIDCHSYCSCGCGGGSRFCGEGCRSCSCGCGPGSSCDQRRVCCNNFRYGQCMQHVTCTGPVWCRVVTCTPPWRVAAWRCSTTPATDDRTGGHTAPSLPGCTPVQQKYTALGGQSGALGEPTTAELPNGTGAYQHFDGGSVHRFAETGTWATVGAIRSTWAALGWEGGPLGRPVADEGVQADGVGRFQHFDGTGGSSVHSHPSHGTWATHGEIRRVWAAQGWERGRVGHPTSPQGVTSDRRGHYQHFAGSGGSSVHSHPTLGTWATHGDVRRVWASLGWESGRLGHPVGPEGRTGDGQAAYQHFSGSGGSSVHAHPQHGAHATSGAVRDRWSRSGWEAGPLGYPVSGQGQTSSGVLYQHFSGGGGSTVHVVPSVGAVVTSGAVRARWAATGWERGPLGLPVADQRTAPGGRGVLQDFLGGGSPSAPDASIAATTATGAHSVRGPVRRAWLDEGGTSGPLGYPVGEPYAPAPSRLRSDFEGGYVEHDAATGRTTVVRT